MQEKSEAVLVLEDGTVFKGVSVGLKGKTSGEIAFNTGMTGYQEVFTDPSYYGQVLIMTTAHIGNYGVHESENESEGMKISGIVIKKFSDGFSRAASGKSLNDFMVESNKVGIADVDTRALVRHVRSKGAMNVIISSEDTIDVDKLKEEVKSVPSMDGLELSSKVATKVAFTKGDENSDLRVALLDFGVKNSIISCLTDRGCYVKVFPLGTSLESINEFKPDGYMLSNGPGDPSVMNNEIKLVNDIVGLNKPTFGICLGHQILGISQGLTTVKMFNGHRGINHPVKNLITGKGEITSQNHGFVISKESVEESKLVELTHIHLNDDTVAGIKLKNKDIFSVQYHPEASAGPHDSRYLFDQFVNNMKKNK